MDYAYLGYGRATDVPTPRERRIYRILELQPGIFAWGTLAAVAISSYLIPAAAALFIIIFDIYWLLKTIYLSMHMSASFRKMRANLKRDWSGELERVRGNAPELSGISAHDIWHAVILPMYKEPVEIVLESIRSLANASWDPKRMLVVLATEGRAAEHARAVAARVREEFGETFAQLLITEHPDGREGEIPGKGSNEAWAGIALSAAVAKQDIPREHVIVSVFDIDTVVPPDFFACLAWNYLTAERPLRSSFQPIPIFTNNIWQAPAFARVFAFSTTFWQMIQQARPEQLVTFSSQSISLAAIQDVGYWQKNVVSEDSQIFWKCLLRYDGDWRTIPMHFPVYMDANVAPTFWGTVINQYKQIRRWHYGVENNPYFLFGFLKNARIPFLTKWRYGFNMIEKTHSSATNALIIFLLGWLPTTIGGGAFSQTILSYNLPSITRLIMMAAMVGLISSAIISIILLPPRPPHYGKYKWLWMILQWLLFPVNFILFGAIPALDAQTRLLFGKYMGFWVTPKMREHSYSR